MDKAGTGIKVILTESHTGKYFVTNTSMYYRNTQSTWEKWKLYIFFKLSIENPGRLDETRNILVYSFRVAVFHDE